MDPFKHWIRSSTGSVQTLLQSCSTYTRLCQWSLHAWINLESSAWRAWHVASTSNRQSSSRMLQLKSTSRGHQGASSWLVCASLLYPWDTRLQNVDVPWVEAASMTSQHVCCCLSSSVKPDSCTQVAGAWPSSAASKRALHGMTLMLPLPPAPFAGCQA